MNTVVPCISQGYSILMSPGKLELTPPPMDSALQWSPKDASVTSACRASPLRPGLHPVCFALALFHLPFLSFSTLLLLPVEGREEAGFVAQPPCTRKVSLSALTKDILKTARLLRSALIVALQQLKSPPWLHHPDAAFLSSR